MKEQARIVGIADQRLTEIREAKTRLQSALRLLDEQLREVLAAAVAGELVAQRDEELSEHSRAPASAALAESDLFGQSERVPNLEGFDPVLPAGWAWSRVDEAGEVTLGRQRSPKHERGKHMRPYLRVANVYEDRIDTSDVLRMNFEPAEVAIYELRDGDILLNEGQSPELVGRPAIYRGEVPGACFQNTLIRFRAYEHVDPNYALLVFRHYMHSGVFKSVARWSTNIAHLGLERYRALPFPTPPLAEQTRIVQAARDRLRMTQQQISAVQTSLARLPDLEQELFAAAVAGELAPQNPNDEPASALASRLGGPPQAVTALTAKSPRGRNMPKRKPRPSRQAEPSPDLTSVLRENGGVLALPDLFALAGYNRDMPEHVELFYIALRDGMNVSFRLRGEATENAEVELIDAA